MRRRFTLLDLAVVVSTLAVVVGTATGQIVFGSEKGGWVYPYVAPFSLISIAVALACSLLLAGLTAVSVRAVDRNQWWVIGAWLVAGLGVQLVLRGLSPVSLESIILSDTANSFYSPTLKYHFMDLIRAYPNVRVDLPLHAQSNMPGKIGLFYILGSATSDPRVLGILVIAVSNLGAVLIYQVARELYQDRRTALFAAILYLALPCRIFLFPGLNTVSPVFILSAFCVFLAVLAARRAVWAIALGGVLYAVVFFDPLVLAMGLVFAAFFGHAIISGRITGDTAGRVIGFTALGFVASYAFMLALGYETFADLALVFIQADDFNPHGGRPHAVWAIENLREFGMGSGVGIVLLFLAGTAHDLRSEGGWGKRLRHPATLLGVSTLAVLFSLDALGYNRGEVVRLWIFLACFLPLVAAHSCARAPGLGRFLVVLGCTLLQTSVTVSRVGFVLPD